MFTKEIVYLQQFRDLADTFSIMHTASVEVRYQPMNGRQQVLDIRCRKMCELASYLESKYHQHSRWDSF